jgi:hypothetical protein
MLACLHQPRSVSGCTPTRGPIRFTAAFSDRSGSCSRASATSRCARSRNSFGYFLGAGTTPLSRGFGPPTRPVATQRQRLRLGMLAALDQRISVRYALAGMDATETADYLTHHLKIAGRADTLFSSDAITLIHNASRGYPPAVNNIAVNALTAAFARDSSIVDERAARTAISEAGVDWPFGISRPNVPSPRRSRPRPQPAGGAFSSLDRRHNR